MERVSRVRPKRGDWGCSSLCQTELLINWTCTEVQILTFLVGNPKIGRTTMTADDPTIERLIAEQQERPLPQTLVREVSLPDVPGKADALIGMRRSGKTSSVRCERWSLGACLGPGSSI